MGQATETKYLLYAFSTMGVIEGDLNILQVPHGSQEFFTKL